MRKTLLFILCFTTGLTSFAAGPHQFGAGMNYWKLNDRPSSYDKDGFSYYGLYRYNRGFWGYEIDLEHYPEDSIFSNSDAVWEPQAYILVGKWIYGAAGVGWQFGESELPSSPTYYLKAGLNFSVFPFMKLDINAQYKYQKLKDFETDKNESVDAVTVGASLNIAL
jgi:hypothetical protein